MDNDDCCVVITCAGNAESGADDGPCHGIRCGPNAECRHEVFRGEQAETICVCKDGYTGDPDSRDGCSAHVQIEPSGHHFDPGSGHPGRGHPPKAACQVKNETYGVGAEWFDGCEYKCQCSEKFEILCQPRCKVLPPDADTDDARCELRRDPEDDCCSVMFCPDPDAIESDLLKPVGLPFEGCLFKNATYNQGERFYDGCEQQCQCMGYGDMVCVSR